MTERPILFSEQMVSAIRAGRKTQTRRVEIFSAPPTDNNRAISCPYGQPGDVLWVREKWRITRWDAENWDWTIEYADGATKRFDSVNDLGEDKAEDYWIQCTDDCDAAGVPLGDDDMYQFGDEHPCPTRWRPSIFMPRCFSRIALEVVSVRVERLRMISRDDAKAEGVSPIWEWPGGKDRKFHARGQHNPYVANFSVLWDSINASRGHGWDNNPWVWVIEFRVMA